MNSLERDIWRACAELGLHVDMGFRLALPEMDEVATIARIEGLGAPNGMLILHSYAAIRNVKDRIIHEGYGFSVLDDRPPGIDFDLESFKEMFCDWGWSGEKAKKPSWMR